MAKDWKRAGNEIRMLRAGLGYKTLAEFAAKVGLSNETIGNIENGRRESYSPGIQVAIEEALGWAQGSFMAVVEGRQPTHKEDPLLDRLRRAWPNMDEQTKKVLVEIIERLLQKT